MYGRNGERTPGYDPIPARDENLDLGDGLILDPGWDDAPIEVDSGVLDLSQKLRLELTYSEFTEFAVRLGFEGEFSFEHREYLREIYDCDENEILLLNARQTEKCCVETQPVLLHDGSVRPMAEIEEWDLVPSLGSASTVSVGRVSWKSDRFKRPCVAIETRQGHKAKVGKDHPIRQWNRWTPAGLLKRGDRIAVVRRAGEFTGCIILRDAEVEFIAFMIGDGSCAGNCRFTQSFGPVLDRFLAVCFELNIPGRLLKERSRHVAEYNLRLPARAFLHSAGLWGKHSRDKSCPPWVWQLDRRQTALFLNRLWSTDGSVKRVTNRKIYNLVYGTTSKALAYEVQCLLWKFGIPTRIRIQTPKAYLGTRRRSYLVRVETQAGVRKFLLEIGALGKTEEFPPPDHIENNNRDTYPKELNLEINRLCGSRSPRQQSRLHRLPAYPLTKRKLAKYIAYFRSRPDVPNRETADIEAHLDTDLFWDEVVSVRSIGEQWCRDITVADTNSFVVGGIITHNSTSHGNWMLCSGIFHPGIRCLYVSPSDPQTKMFSFERVRSVLSSSPRLARYANRANLSVYNIPLLNGSLLLMRSCYLSADRVRGIRADRIIIDEYQDILTENTPVIRECSFHAPAEIRRFRYSGTPKTFDNPINRLWERHSTMTELVFPCRAHGTPNKPWTWHWNVIRERNIGLHGLICDRCGGPLDQRDPDATWADTAPKARERKVRGYHISQPITPMAHRTPEDWQELLIKRERYSRAKFSNEVMGESYDFGTKPFNESDFIQAQVQGWHMTPEQLERMILHSKTTPVFAGIDWGGADVTKKTMSTSYTVVSLATYAPELAGDRLFVFYWHRFTGQDEDKEIQLRKIYDLLRAYGVRFTIADYGMGGTQNDYLVRRFGLNRYARMQYVGKQQGRIVWRSKLGWFTAYKTAVCNDIINAVKKGKIAFPDWRAFAEPYGQDMLNLLAEYNERKDETMYIHHADCTVDSFHSLVYSISASLREFPRGDITSLTIDTEIEHGIVMEHPATGEPYIP